MLWRQLLHITNWGANMPIGKDIYNVLSKKHGERKARLDNIVKKRINSGDKPVMPPTVEQFKKNVVTRTKLNSIHISELAGASKRQLSPNEGMPAINGKSGKELVEKAVTKIRPRVTKIDATAGAILPKETKKKKNETSRKTTDRRCGNCNKAGHTKRSCPQSS